MTRLPIPVPALVALTAGLALVPAAPAAADATGDFCWEDLDTGGVRCFASADELYADLGAPAAVAARSAAETQYTLGTFYEDISYGGAFYLVRSSNSTLCATGSTTLNLPSAWNNRISSYKTWYGCSGTLYDGTAGTGASYGPSTAAPSVGSMNDKASSVRHS
jgi:hypothetical protein